MTAVWKYDVPYGDRCEILMPEGAEPLSFGMQSGRPTLWARVDPAQPATVRRFRFAGTGHDLGPGDLRYIGTAFDSPFVWHLFELFG